MIKNWCVLIFSFLLLGGNFLQAQPPRVEKTAQWSQQGYYILNPAFGRTGHEMAFARRFSGRDSSINAAKSFLQAATQNHLARKTINSRLLDPVVSIWDYDKQQLSLIDYGWSPAFSTNDNRLAYAYQANPLQRPDQLYADAYRGNSIKIFNKSGKKIEEVARPLNNYLLDPFFADSLALVYKTGDRVNGPYGGAVSFNEVNLVSKKTRLIRQPGIKYRLYELMGEPYIVDKKLAYIVYSPADSGSGMAGDYRHLLLSEKDTLHDFGVRRFTNLNYKFAINAQKELLFLDDGNFLAEDTNYIVKYKNDRFIERRPLDSHYSSGYLSPDGRYLFYLTTAMEGYLLNTRDFSQAKLDMSQKELHAIVWSIDGNRFALVQDHEKFTGTDQLTVYDIQ